MMIENNKILKYQKKILKHKKRRLKHKKKKMKHKQKMLTNIVKERLNKGKNVKILLK